MDINSDSQSLEIVGSNGMPIFQISVISYQEWKELQEINNQNMQQVISKYIEDLNLPQKKKKNILESKARNWNNNDIWYL